MLGFKREQAWLKMSDFDFSFCNGYLNGLVIDQPLLVSYMVAFTVFSSYISHELLTPRSKL